MDFRSHVGDDFRVISGDTSVSLQLDFRNHCGDDFSVISGVISGSFQVSSVESLSTFYIYGPRASQLNIVKNDILRFAKSHLSFDTWH